MCLDTDTSFKHGHKLCAKMIQLKRSCAEVEIFGSGYTNATRQCSNFERRDAM